MLKTGEQHRQSLRDGRQVFIDGSAVSDVTEHPAFKRSIGSSCGLYDYHSAEANRERMTFCVAPSDERANRIWQLPTSYEELKARREALEAWAGLHAGFLGRSPDHVASCISGMYMGIEVFERYDPDRASALADYYRYARDNDIYLSYVIINPQADRSKAEPAGGHISQRRQWWTGTPGHHGARRKDARRPAAIMANEVFVTSIQPLQPGDEKLAVSFAIPMNAKGLSILSRKSYEQLRRTSSTIRFRAASMRTMPDLFRRRQGAVGARVRRRRHRMCQKQFHAYARPRLSELSGADSADGQIAVPARNRSPHRLHQRHVGFPQVREMLGQLAAEVAMVEGLVSAWRRGVGSTARYFVPDRHLLYAAQMLTQQLYPKVVNTLRELAGGAMIMLPSSIADFAQS